MSSFADFNEAGARAGAFYDDGTTRKSVHTKLPASGQVETVAGSLGKYDIKGSLQLDHRRGTPQAEVAQSYDYSQTLKTDENHVPQVIAEVSLKYAVPGYMDVTPSCPKLKGASVMASSWGK